MRRRRNEADYTAFDAELLRLIAAGKNRTMLLEHHAPLIVMAKRIGRGCLQSWRVIARRLQALRREGKVRFSRGVWGVL